MQAGIMLLPRRRADRDLCLPMHSDSQNQSHMSVFRSMAGGEGGGGGGILAEGANTCCISDGARYNF